MPELHRRCYFQRVPKPRKALAREGKSFSKIDLTSTVPSVCAMDFRTPTEVPVLEFGSQNGSDSGLAAVARPSVVGLSRAVWKASSASPGGVNYSSPSPSELANVTALCEVDVLPSLNEYLAAISVAGVTLFTVSGIAVLSVILIYIDTLKHIMRKASSPVKTNSAFVLSVYPVVCLATYCAMVVPRAQLLAEAVTQGIFTAAIYQLFCLCMSYCGGEAELIRTVAPDSLTPKVGPCCCWPCCCLPNLKIDKRHIRMLRLLVLQLPVVQALVLMVLLVMWAEEESLYTVNYMYFQPLIVMSILCGIWGMSMTIKMLSVHLITYKLQSKFMVLQMVLLLSKLQGLIARIVLWSDLLPCKPPISPAVYGNVIYNTLMIAEMAALSVIARYIYVKGLSDCEPKGKKNITQVAVIGEKFSQMFESGPPSTPGMQMMY
ncbi:hypothetical protein J437_LFUL009773 [Ladona fulva]|uniref:Organic solute transporter alpha-like protein n=1 Tax=Ladona fulva TaxID=123851 RepID=A0A8K0P3R5_LADFU|nr:hypothetical protein J437_LFUL009773 [Ladona fulva]